MITKITKAVPRLFPTIWLRSIIGITENLNSRVMIKKAKNDPISNGLGIGQIHFVEQWLDLHGIPYLKESISKYVYENGDLAYFKVRASKNKMIEEYKRLGIGLPYFMDDDSEVQIVFRRKKSKSSKR